jgi:hypothetical protein
MAWKLAYASCENMSDPGIGWLQIAREQPRVFISQGDTPYANGSASGDPAFSSTTTPAEALVKYQRFWNRPSVVSLMALRATGMLAYWQADDHEWANDNWDHTKTQAGSGANGFTTQALVNAHWVVGNEAQETLLAERFDHPPYDRAGNSERPSEALTESQNPPTTDYPIKYFVRDFDASGNLAGGPSHCRVIFVDCISYRSPVAATESLSKRMLGAQQEAWLIARLAECAGIVPFVFLASTKKLFRGSSDNGDTFGDYTTERNRLLTAIDATGVKPVWLSGDRHTLHVSHTTKAGGFLADILDVCACPIGVSINGVSSNLEGLQWASQHRRGYGLLTFMGDRVRIEIKHAADGSRLWACDVLPFSNTPDYSAFEVTARRAV